MTPFNPNMQAAQPLAGGPPGLASLLKGSITGFVAKTIRPVVETDKTIWNARVRRNELYYRGLQDLIYAPSSTGTIDYQSISAGQNLQLTTGAGQESLYDYVLNFYQGDVDTFIAVIGARSPNGQAQARDLGNEQQIRLKMKADRVNSYLESHWNVPLLHQRLVRGLALYGTMFSHVRYTSNPRKYGVTPVQKYQQQFTPSEPPYYHCPNCGAETEMMQAQAIGAQTGAPRCQQCGNPLGPENLIEPESILSLVPTEVIPYANGAVECSILNPAHVTTQVSAPDLDHAPWLIDEAEDDKGAVVRAFPELRDKAYLDTYSVGSDAAAAMGRYTRELVTSVSGYTTARGKGRWLVTRIWITPACFEYLPNDRTGDLREWLYRTYPDGIMAPMVNGELLVGDPNKKSPEFPNGTPNRITNERLTSVWAACKPKPSEMIYADPYFDCMIQGQDTINDCVSMLIEQAERSNPFVIADPEILDPDMLRQFSSIPGEFKFAKPGSAGALDKGFFRVPAATLNEVLISFIDKYVSWCREITGITPALFGGGEAGPEKTARQYEIMRNQAMMKLNVPWTNIRQFWAKTRENGIYQAAKFSGGKLFSADSRGTVETTEIEGIWELIKGGWFMECEESMPQTIGQRRDFVMNALTMGPEAQQKLGMDEPDNLIEVQEAVGISGWVTPGYSQVIRLHDIISRLAQAQPTSGPPGPPDPMTGMPGPPGPPQPSIPFEIRLFDPSLALKVVQQYLLGDRGATLEMSNPGGYANVMAYLDAVHQAMPPPPPRDPSKVTFTANIPDLTPPAQQAVFQAAGIQMAPGTIIAQPPPPKPAPGTGGPQPNGGPGLVPHNPLASPPPNAVPPSDLASNPPIPALAMPAPGVLQ